jgi:hypothetical protein
MQTITLVNPSTGVRFQYKGQWLRSSPATDTDIKKGRARFRGDKVNLHLPPGVQAQLDKGVLQIDTDFDSREALDDADTGAVPMPKGNASAEAWISYAVSQGMDRDEAVSMSRDQLKARFTAPVFDPDAPPGLDMLNEKP